MTLVPEWDCQNELISLFETLVDVMFCMKSVDGTYVRVNAAFVRRTGRKSKREVVGHPASEIFHPDLAERYEDQDHHVFESGEPLRDELELIQRPDLKLGWYLTTKLPIFNRENPSEVVGLVSVSRDLKTPTNDEPALGSLQQVVFHVRDHLTDSIRVADLAKVAGCSIDQLERRLRKVFGITAKQYILRVRVDRATELLASSNIALAEVAAQSGFYDQSNLTRVFARLTNQTPAQFRSMAHDETR